ncbi:MAG: hypothetical protein KBT06_11605 [Prevotellaceae bacterium]|nr:hypothetical protein [Candidatus Colivivens equi]
MNIIRWWHSKGFGIQSPWAFRLVTEVLNDRKNNLHERLRDYLGDYPRWVIVEHIDKENKTIWKTIVSDETATATFDMKHLGLAVYDPKRYKQHYII